MIQSVFSNNNSNNKSITYSITKHVYKSQALSSAVKSYGEYTQKAYSIKIFNSVHIIKNRMFVSSLLLTLSKYRTDIKVVSLLLTVTTQML